MKYGFIGLGNMASAIIRGLVKNGVPGADIYGSGARPATGQALAGSVGLNACAGNAAVVASADVIVLAVKPQVLPGVLEEIKALPLDGKLFISIAAGLTLAWLRGSLGPVPLVRVMPNINSKIGAATSLLCAGPDANEEQVRIAREIFSTVGTVSDIPEHLFAAATAISGASPAFTYMYIDAMARAALRFGLPRKLALKIAASSVAGSARMILESDEHPMSLADQVCSPAGTTIAGVVSLQRNAFESAVHQAVEAVILRDREIAR
ncbi:MAG: pyrroline-5-carboxylate reductase [Deltaproteobacteria bacterium]|nr:pyrroline-5-carboxylate reductase [Deltaproteobacteria bacterium]